MPILFIDVWRSLLMYMALYLIKFAFIFLYGLYTLRYLLQERFYCRHVRHISPHTRLCRCLDCSVAKIMATGNNLVT